MPTLLVIEVSPRFERSASRNLTAQFVKKWKAAHPGGTVIVRDLVKTKLPFVDLAWMGGAYTPSDQRTPESATAIKISDELTAELKAADQIVIGTPMYNFSVPAMLKAYIDHIVRVGVTVSTSNEGLLKGKKTTVIIASGGDFSPGAPYESYNQASGYLRQVLGFIGLTDVNIILAGSAKAIDQGQTTMVEFTSQFESALASAAAI